MLRSRSLDLAFIRRAGRKRSAAIRSVSQAFLRSAVVMAAVTSSSDLAAQTASAAPSKRSRGLADIDPKFVSNSGLSGLSEVGTPRGGSVRIQHRPPRHPSGGSLSNALPVIHQPAEALVQTQSRFPKLDECAHFHYDVVDLGPLAIQMYDESGGKVPSGEEHPNPSLWALQITSYGKSWIIRRSYEHFRILDEQLHRCIYDRKFSQLPLLPETASTGIQTEVALRPLLSGYVSRLSAIAGNLINCAPVLNWLEVDNRGRRLYPPPPSEDADAEINTPAVAAAYAVRRYAAIASDEISFEVGDMISVIDMPAPEESMWWRGKRGFDVGFFPSECVRVIGDKLPAHLSHPSSSSALPIMASAATAAAAVSAAAAASSSSSSPLKASGVGVGGGSSDHLPMKPVLRKHGKLISFFRSFILSRPSRRKLKQSGILKERVFGCDLGEHLLNSGREIPMVLKCCAEFIEEYGIVDGIYRLSGITSNIQKLRNAFDEDRVPALVEDEAIRQDMHAVSSLLKMYFRELPNPLCTYQLYDQFVNAVQGPDHLRVIRMREVVQQLPPPHFRTLEYLTRHLARVANNSASTGMTAKNVAIVWAPNLLRCKELEVGGVAALQGVGVQAVVTECLVRYVDLIFSDKAPVMPQLSDELPPPGSASGALKRTRPKSLAISTPTKLLSLEEARNRALQLASSQNDGTQYIEVGGGPASLPPKYHTVIELPNGDGRAKRGNSLKHKKSPLGWKSFFAPKPAKDRSSSNNKAQRKGSSASTGSTVSMPVATGASVAQRAVTYIRPRLRPVKSAESLVNNSNRNSSSEIHQTTTTSPGAKASAAAPIQDDALVECPAVDAGEEDDQSLSRCHNRSVSHDSYFRLLVTGRADETIVSPVAEEESSSGAGQAAAPAAAIYAEISKPGRTPKEPAGAEFGKDLNLTAVEDPHSGSSKMSLNDLSHLDDSELNLMGSREMLASSRTTGGGDVASPGSGSHFLPEQTGMMARPASADDSVIDDSARAVLPINAEQMDERGNWAASNPAYELFHVQAEVHSRLCRSPSPDNTEAQMPDMPSEVVAMDGEDNDSLLNVGTDDYSSTEVTGSDRESFTLHGTNGPDPTNDVYENVNVADNRTLADVESIRRTATSPLPPPSDGAYENYAADNQPYAVVRIAKAGPTTYENVIVSEEEERYEPIQPVATSTQQTIQVNACYEAIQHQVGYENVDDQPSYENVDDQPRYENLEDPRPAPPMEQPDGYECVEPAAIRPAETIDADNETYENVNLGQPSARKAMEVANEYEDVIPPPPKVADTEEVIYHQVKVLRRSIQEVNELLREDPTILQTALDVPTKRPPTPTSPTVVVAASAPLPPRPAAHPSEEASKKKKKSIEKDFRERKLEYVIRDIAVDDPPQKESHKEDVRLSLSPAKRPSDPEASAPKDLSLSLPSLLNNSQPSNNNKKTSVASHSLPPTPSHQPDRSVESESAASSKRRFESEIGRDLLRERKIRSEVESSRQGAPPSRRQSTPESPITAKLPGGKPALPVKTLKKSGEILGRPTTLETSFDYDPSPARRASSPPSTGSPLSPVSPSSEGRNFLPSGVRKTSVKELLNKFQSDGLRATTTTTTTPTTMMTPITPTSPVKPSPPVLTSSSLPESSAESKKVNKDKENIEVLLTPSPPKTALTGMSSPGSDHGEALLPVSNNNSDSLSSRDSSLEESAKDILRQKAPGIDMTDPRTRLRIERYKEERRSFLREKYKSESFRSDGKEDPTLVRLKQKAGSPTHSADPPPPPGSRSPEPGLIDEDVNVKERAAQWSTTSTPIVAPPAIQPGINRSCSEAAAAATAPQQKRIRDMAALFEKESP